jgi:hypothetical protein
MSNKQIKAAANGRRVGTVTGEQTNKSLETQKEGELSDDELDIVTGGTGNTDGGGQSSRAPLTEPQEIEEKTLYHVFDDIPEAPLNFNYTPKNK